MRAVAKRLEGNGERTEAVGAELTVIPQNGAGGRDDTDVSRL